MTSSRIFRISMGIALLAAVIFLGLTYGPVTLSWQQVGQSLIHPFGSSIPAIIIWDIRLPRLIAAALVGGALGTAGAVMQALFKNPLADPYIVGASAGAGFGAMLLSLLLPASGLMGVGAFIGAITAVFAAYLLARGQGRVHMLTLILAGYALSLVLGALTTFVMLAHQKTLTQVLSWELGGIHGIGWHELLWPSIMIIVALVATWPFAPELNAFYLGEEQAHYLGVNVMRAQTLLLILASLLTAASVYLAGLIGFVGLVIPHIIRRLQGSNHHLLLPLSFFAGAIFLVGADILAEQIPWIGTVPVGLVSDLIGGPYFVYILFKTRVVSG
ncbi:ABC transporter [Sulfobacillus sp. hq2]|nr:ABC transporter [Sulfobacillus sp. hq2]